MKKKSNPEEFPSPEKIREMLAALWPELQTTEDSSSGETQNRLSSPQNPADALNEDEINELLRAVEPLDKDDILQPAEIEQILNTLAKEPGHPHSENQSLSPSSEMKPPLTHEERKFLLKSLGAISLSPAGDSAPLDHQTPLTEEEVERLVKALSQEE